MDSPLPLAGTEVAHARARVHGHAEHLEEGGRLPFPVLVVDEARTVAGLAREEDVLGDGEGWDQARLLEVHGDAGGAGLLAECQRDVLTRFNRSSQHLACRRIVDVFVDVVDDLSAGTV